MFHRSYLVAALGFSTLLAGCNGGDEDGPDAGALPSRTTLASFVTSYEGSSIPAGPRSATTGVRQYGQLSIDDKLVERSSHVCADEGFEGLVPSILRVLNSGNKGALIVTATPVTKHPGLSATDIPLLTISYDKNRCTVHPLIMNRSEYFSLSGDQRMEFKIRVVASSGFDSAILSETVETASKALAAAATLGIGVDETVTQLAASPIAAAASKFDELVQRARTSPTFEDQFSLVLEPSSSFAKSLVLSRNRSSFKSELGIGLLPAQSLFEGRKDLRVAISEIEVTVDGSRTPLPELFRSTQAEAPIGFNRTTMASAISSGPASIQGFCEGAKRYLREKTFLSEQDVILSLYLVLQGENFFRSGGQGNFDLREEACFSSGELSTHLENPNFNAFRADVRGFQAASVSYARSVSELQRNIKEVLLTSTRLDANSGFKIQLSDVLSSEFVANVQSPELISRLPDTSRLPQGDVRRNAIAALASRLDEGFAFQLDRDSPELRGLLAVLNNAGSWACFSGANAAVERKQTRIVGFLPMLGGNRTTARAVRLSSNVEYLPIAIGGRFYKERGKERRFELTSITIAEPRQLRVDLGLDQISASWPSVPESTCRSIRFDGKPLRI